VIRGDAGKTTSGAKTPSFALGLSRDLLESEGTSAATQLDVVSAIANFVDWS